jgi:calcineurin-like phosphoesterase family protein
MTIWFTSDTHFSHANIIKYCNRPFASVDVMDETLIKNWNDCIKYGDLVYFLGDFAFRRRQGLLSDLLDRLNGNIYLIYGNHDDGPIRDMTKFKWQGYYKEIKIGSYKIVLMHYAMRTWRASHHGSWHLYGHSHGTLKEDPGSRSFDVGVDANNYKPISFEEVKERMSKKIFVPIDHHAEE